jgi:hypothetical protein
MPAAEVAKINSVCGPVLRALGYPLDRGPAGGAPVYPAAAPAPALAAPSLGAAIAATAAATDDKAPWWKRNMQRNRGVQAGAGAVPPKPIRPDEGEGGVSVRKKHRGRGADIST